MCSKHANKGLALVALNATANNTREDHHRRLLASPNEERILALSKIRNLVNK